MSGEVLAFDEPDGAVPRGTLVVLAGRGESAEVYRRFGARLAADAYRVRVLTEQAGDIAERLGQLLGADAPGLRILVGSDTGALRALVLADDVVPALDGVILAGLPAGDDVLTRAAQWDEELDARTACPVHRRRISDGLVRPGALADPVPAELSRTPDGVRLTIPVLALHGEVDLVSPLAAARERINAVADPDRLQAATIAGGRHDVLNDQSHRSVAATIVLWLERLRGGPEMPQVVLHGAAA